MRLPFSSCCSTHATLLGYDKTTIELLRGENGYEEDYNSAEPPIQMQEDNPNDWIDEDMPVDPAFMDAIRDVSELHRYVTMLFKLELIH